MLSDFIFAQEVPDQIARRVELWQQYLERRSFTFPRDERGLFTSLDHYSATCQLHIIISPKPDYRISFKFVRDGREVLALPGHFEATFRTTDEKLYFANFSPLDVAGCTVSAYDLNSGSELWKTDDISHLKAGGASQYGNLVHLWLSRLNEVANEPEGAAIIVMGTETAGDYIAVLDRMTGVLLAHKKYKRSRPTGGGFGGQSQDSRKK
jgi:hypothetical protein